jgi:hypothetical protein
MLHLRAKAVKTIARSRKTHTAARVRSAALTTAVEPPHERCPLSSSAGRLLIGPHFRPELA